MQTILIYNPHFTHFTGGGEVNDKNIRKYSRHNVKIVSIKDKNLKSVNAADIRLKGHYKNRIGHKGVSSKVLRAFNDIYYGIKFVHFFISTRNAEGVRSVTVTGGIMIALTIKFFLIFHSVKVMWAIRGKNSKVVNILVKYLNLSCLYWGRSAILNQVFTSKNVLEPGVDEIFFDSKLYEASRPSLVFIGRYDDNKGLDFLVRWLSSQDTGTRELIEKVNIFGAVSPCPELIDDKLVFHGSLIQSEMIKKIHSNDIYVCCSRYENYPLTLCEMKVLGIKCVAPRVEFTDYEPFSKMNLFLYASRNHNALTQCVKKAIDAKPKVYDANNLNRWKDVAYEWDELVVQK